MNKKMNNKTLLSVLAILVLVFFTTNYLKNNNSDNILQTDLVSVDTSKISEIIIHPANKSKKDVSFSNDNGTWNVKSGQIKSETKNGDMGRILSELAGIKIERLITKSKEKWEKYQLTDSLATLLEIKEKGSSSPLKLYLGKVNYQAPQGGGRQFNAQNFSAQTNIRVNDDDKVYLVNGFLGMMFNRDFNAWRNNEFIKINQNSITSLQFTHPADTSFTLAKVDSVWRINNKSPDSTKLAKFLGLLSNKTINEFNDDFTPASAPEHLLKISGNNMKDIEIKCYRDLTQNRYLMESSLNPGVFFSSKEDGIFSQVFIGAGAIL
jgi:hypothetical protein